MAERESPSDSQLAGSGQSMHDLIAELYPICRSLTGQGVVQTLDILKRGLPLDVVEVPSGTRVFDWTVPREWNVRDAFIADSTGRRVVDFQQSNLHLVGYSIPVAAEMTLDELRPHLHTLPERPDWVPYRTSYYREDWGFCLSQRQLESLAPGKYRVQVDSTLTDGQLRYGEVVLPGESDDEVLFSTYLCHPSLCNDNLSGVALLAELGRRLADRPRRRWTYRLLFIPETIGAIAWLARNEDRVDRIRAGLVVTCVGDPGPMTYKRSRQGNTWIDRAVETALRDAGRPYEVLDFFPTGSDERQFCSPGFNLPVGSLMRTPYGRFPEYHTSADNLDFVRPEALEESLARYLDVVEILEHDRLYENTNPKCEPQLGRRGLYSSVGGPKSEPDLQTAMLWILNQSDKHNSLLDIAIRSGLSFSLIRQAAERLHRGDLLRPA
jgi:aminopeptidase-like protein